MADEAGLSRLYGGIHYRVDIEVGRDIGVDIGEIATTAMDLAAAS
jgi:hypothetical protein